jgi:pyruvate/2-oxoglutarate dehydrogenase complex dihydrolipoamide acyltransferase (E2) component
MPNRADNEVFLHETIDATELVRYLEEKNSGDIDYKTTIFHCVITALARMVRERPIMNRFIQGGRIYQRYDISLSFVAKKRFTDGADEALMVLVPKDTDTINEISRKIVGDVKESRKTEGVTAGSIDELMAKLAKLPRLLLMFIVWTVRVLDYWGINPDFLTDGDPNYTTILVSNLGSIKCPSVYHHLNNYGTNSIMVTIGTMHKEEILMDDGHKEIRDVVDIGATLDERIGDGFYFAKSLKLIKHIFAHPELLEQPLNEESGFDYK